MSLLNNILAAIKGPKSETGAGAGDLSGLLSGLRAAAASAAADSTAGVDPQALVSALGAHVKSALQRIEGEPTPDTADQLVSQLAARDKAPDDLIARLFGSNGGRQVAEDISRKTGISSQAVLSMLPVLLPLVMKLLQPGAGGGIKAVGSLVGNPILKSFLNSKRPGDLDMADVIKMAGSFLGKK